MSNICSLVFIPYPISNMEIDTMFRVKRLKMSLKRANQFQIISILNNYHKIGNMHIVYLNKSLNICDINQRNPAA